MALALTIGATTQTSFIKHESMSLKFNTFDFALQNPSTVPAVGDAVSLTDTGLSWSGSVSSVQITDTVEKGTNKLVSVSATNSDEASASAATFGLSDTPNGSTTFGYAHLTTESTLDRDGTTTTEGSLTTYHGGIWPAMTFELTSANRGYSAQDFTAQNVTVTWPKPSAPVYRIEFGDPIVTMSVWLNSSLSGTISTTKITDGSVTTPKLAADAVTAEKVAAGAVTAESLEADLVLGTQIRTAESGNRVELSPEGIRVFDSSESQLLNIPTDDSPISIVADVEASNLVVSGTAQFSSDSNVITEDGELTVEVGIVAPTQKPTLSQGYAIGAAISKPDTGTIYPGHAYYDAAGGTSGTTACLVQAWGKSTGANLWEIKVYEWNWSTGALDRTTTIESSISSTSPLIPAITRIGTSWYVVINQSSALKLRKYTRSTGAFVSTATITADFTGYDSFATPISTDGTDVFVPGGAGTDQLRICRYNTSLVKQATIALTEPTFPGSNLGWPAQYVISNSSGSNRHYIGLQHTDSSGVQTGFNVYDFNLTTGALGSNTEFPFLTISGGNTQWYPLVYDGANFWGRSAAYGTFSQFTNWTWTTESAKYWVAYSWYDSAGTTHETAVGPRASITMKKRARMSVTMPSLPGAGGADDPDNRRVYMNRGSSDPGAGNFKLQTTSASISATLTTFNTGGAADGGGTAFPSSTGGTIQSAGGEWAFHGDGTYTLPQATVAIATRSANQSISNNATTAVTLPSDSYDPFSLHDTVSNTERITIPVTGTYAVFGQVAWAQFTTASRAILHIEDNAATVLGNSRSDFSTTGSPAQQVYYIGRLTAGAYIYMTAFQNTGVAVNVTDARVSLAYLGT